MTNVPGYQEFEFDLPDALLKQIKTALSKVVAVELTEENARAVPKAPGVYQLFIKIGSKFKLAYIGKTNSKGGLRERLTKHAKKILHRQNISSAEVYFKALRIFVFTAVDLEKQLIKEYGGVKTVPWNGSGFGAKDPGRERDTTKYKAAHFEMQFPIDVERQVEFALPQTGSALAFLEALKQGLPYLIRFERPNKEDHPDLLNAVISLDPEHPKTPASILETILSRLPDGWHATVLPSHIIVYKDDGRKFPSARHTFRSPTT